ncbi:alginate export family protein [Sphingomonas sp. PB2P19]|uniref:alginate export family protein n=1 Tax=Sphingomonas rhamnosi TaxID=3096156 RepID=UPI002FCAC92C
MHRWSLVLTLTAVPAAAQEREAWQPPTLTTTRYDERWSTLADPATRTGRWTEPFKYIPLGDEVYLTTGVEVRLRNEAYRANLWGGGDAPDDGHLWMRAMPYADLHVGRVRGFVQPIAAYAAGVAPSAGPIDQTRVDLLQGFVDVRLGNAETGSFDGAGVTVRAGRQMLSLGTERLVGTRYGPNVPLAFDGFRALATVGGATVSLLAVKPVQPGLGTLDDRSSRTKSLWGVYATRRRLDLYYLGYRNTAARFGTRAGRERRHSIGARTFDTVADWHWNVEGVAQFGRFAGGPIAAWTLGTELGRRFPNAKLAPDAVLRVNIVSGDSHPGDDRLGTFNALFPKGKYFGELSPVGPYNIVSVNPRVAAALGKTVSASLAAMAYWRYSRSDGVYDIPGTLIRAPGTSRARFIGKEAEATLAWQVTPELELSTSISAFAAGQFIRDTGKARTIAMFGTEANFRF